jgi:hypothetical protein
MRSIRHVFRVTNDTLRILDGRVLNVFGLWSVDWQRCLMKLVCVDLFGVAYVLTKALVVVESMMTSTV